MTIAALQEHERQAEQRRCLILANPKAGALSAREFYSTLARRSLQRFRRSRLPLQEPPVPVSLNMLAHLAAEAGLEANVEVVPPPEELPALVRSAQAEGFDTIVAVGGDGTVHNVAQALVHTPLRLGILPMGTANNVARSLGIPFALDSAMRVLAEGVERRIDVGWLGDEYFLEAAGVGLFADALQAFGSDEPRRYQIRRVLRVMGPLLWNLRSRTLEITLDGQLQHEEAVLVTAANGRYLGEGMSLAPDAALYDGLFDVVIVRPLSRAELVRFGLSLMRGTHLNLPKVRLAQAQSVQIRRIHRSHHPLPVHADDHIVGFTPVRMDALPGALRVIVPAEESNV